MGKLKTHKALSMAGLLSLILAVATGCSGLATLGVLGGIGSGDGRTTAKGAGAGWLLATLMDDDKDDEEQPAAEKPVNGPSGHEREVRAAAKMEAERSVPGTLVEVVRNAGGLCAKVRVRGVYVAADDIVVSCEAPSGPGKYCTFRLDPLTGQVRHTPHPRKDRRGKCLEEGSRILVR